MYLQAMQNVPMYIIQKMRCKNHYLCHCIPEQTIFISYLHQKEGCKTHVRTFTFWLIFVYILKPTKYSNTKEQKLKLRNPCKPIIIIIFNYFSSEELIHITWFTFHFAAWSIIWPFHIFLLTAWCTTHVWGRTTKNLLQQPQPTFSRG